MSQKRDNKGMKLRCKNCGDFIKGSPVVVHTHSGYLTYGQGGRGYTFVRLDIGCFELLTHRALIAKVLKV